MDYQIHSEDVKILQEFGFDDYAIDFSDVTSKRFTALIGFMKDFLEEEKKCPDCRGTGWQGHGHPCDTCHQTGKRQEE